MTAASAFAAPPIVTLRQVASTLALPVEIANAGDGSGRLFIVEQAGIIRVLKNGALLPTPFLDITNSVQAGGERGLLGLAFHPQYAANRKFYVFYTSKPAGALQVAEYLASTGNPDLADTGSGRPVIAIPHATADNHNGGHIAFGPEGYLYIATGDGGGGGDPDGNGQNVNVLLGKLLRIDVNTSTGYLIPPTNPFVGQAGADEIWAYGLRNPWKFSFDRLRGDLYIGDVGQGQREEVNFEPVRSGGGRNYGWDMYEGTFCFTAPCEPAGKIFPVIEHTHSGDSFFSITGGYVYRGIKSSALRGYYVYGDYVNNGIKAASTADFVTWISEPLVSGPGNHSTFGEDEAGELYVVNRNTGVLYAIDGPGPAVALPVPQDFNGDGKADILWRNAVTGENYLYPMDGKTILGTEGSLRAVADLNWKVVGIGDFDGDGKADILWRNATSGDNYIYFMDGTTIKPTEGYIRTVADQNWQIAGVGDFNGDGKDDILWRNGSTGENYLYPMDGLTILAAEGYLRTVADLNWKIAGVGDFDGDGKADILWRNSSTGENYLYPMNGTAIKPMEGFVRTVADLNWKIVGVGDFDGDRKADILWRNMSTGENYVYPMAGNAIKPTEGYLRTVADQNWQVKGTEDYDGDGNADVLWRNDATGENYLYPMDGTTILGTEGYLRTVADLNWRVVPAAAVAPGGPPVSAQIAIARATPDGIGLNLPVSNALVTYVKPFIGASDPAGFFIQVEAVGPALFIAVDPAALAPAPAAGDTVSFTITAMATSFGSRQATAISGFTRVSQGNALDTLIQDLTNAMDLSTSLDAYESELIRLEGVIAGAFASAGAGYQQANFNTAGVSGSLKLRVPAALVASLDLAPACEVSLEAVPLWRLNATAQVSAWSAGDFALVSCPAPNVLSAAAASSTSVAVHFDRMIDAASVLPDGSQFSISSGVTVLAAVVSGKTVTLTTSAQVVGAAYTVAVTGSVTDTYSVGVNVAANSALFTGFVPVPVPASIYEVKTGIVPMGAYVQVMGAIVTGVKATTGFFMQVDPTMTGYPGPSNSGVFVSSASATVAPGDQVTVEGTVEAFQGQTRIVAAMTAVTGFASLPPPVSAAPGDIATGGSFAVQYEGVLVTVQNVSVNEVGSSNEFTVSDGLVVDDFLFLIDPQPAVNATFTSITGTLATLGLASKLLPRAAADVVSP